MKSSKIPLNLTADGLAPTLTAVYYKKGAYNFLKSDSLELGGHENHSEIAVLEVYGYIGDTAGDL